MSLCLTDGESFPLPSYLRISKEFVLEERGFTGWVGEATEAGTQLLLDLVESIREGRGRRKEELQRRQEAWLEHQRREEARLEQER
jgi:hypothetical protein